MVRRTIFQFIMAIGCLFSFVHLAYADGVTEINFMSAPTDFALLEPQNPPPPGGPFPYSWTGDSPTWSIVSWNIPNGNLPPFHETHAGFLDSLHSIEQQLLVDLKGHSNESLFPIIEDIFNSRHMKQYQSDAPESQVKIIRSSSSASSTIYSLTQNGNYLPCGDAGGNPFESDLFASPNGAQHPSHEATGLLMPEGAVAVTQLKNLIATSRTSLNWKNISSSKPCAVSQGGPLISVILNNNTAGQTLFYQLEYSVICGDSQPTARLQLCNGLHHNPQASFFSTSNPFGVDEYLTSFGQPLLESGEHRLISVDLLPHILAFISKAPAAMDHNPAHWTIGGYYNGQHIWGNISMATSWTDVSLVGIPVSLPSACVDANHVSHASGSTYTLQVSQTTGSIVPTTAQCTYGGTQATTITTTQTYLCTNGVQTTQGTPTVTTANSGNPVCKAPAACGSTPSGSTVTNTVSTTAGTTAATTAQCSYGGTVPTKTTVTQVSLCTNGTLTAQGAPITTTVASGSPVCTAAPVAGACGSAIATYSPTKPTANLCASGTASTVAGPTPWVGWTGTSNEAKVGPGKWTWSCAGTGGSTTASCLVAAGMPGPGAPLSTDSHTPGYVGKTDFISLPFQSSISTGCWGCSTGLEPMQLFAQANPKSLFWDALSNELGASRNNVAGIEASGIVPSGGSQRWDATFLNSFAANNITVDGLGTLNIPTSLANNATSNTSAVPEFAASRDFYVQHPQYWDIAYNGKGAGGGQDPLSWQSWNGQWGFISPLTPLDKADCPPDMSSCTWGDSYAYRQALTAAMTGGYGLGLSDFSDSFPYGFSNQHDFNPRIVAAFAAAYKLSIPGTTVPEQAAWIVANAYNQWDDYLSIGYGHYFGALAKRLSAATGRQALVIDQCQGSPFESRYRGQDWRIVATQISPNNYICGHDDQIIQSGRTGPVRNPITGALAGAVLDAAYEPLMRHGANIESDDSAYWKAIKSFYPGLDSADQTEVGYKLMKRLWLSVTWAHIADRSGDTRRALSFTSRDYFDYGKLTAAQLGPLQSLIQTIVPTHPFGPAIYYSQSAMKAAEAYFAKAYGIGGNLFSNIDDPVALTGFVDQGGPVGYYVSDAALSQIQAGSANAPSAWIVLQNINNMDPVQQIPAAELSKLQSIAPVISVDWYMLSGQNWVGKALAQFAALPNQPLTFTTTGGAAPISAACASAGFPTYLLKSTALTGFGFYDQSNRLIVVTSNPSPCPDAVALSGTINLQNIMFAGKLANGTYTLTDLFANQSTTVNIIEGKATIQVNVARWDSLAYAIAPAQ